MAASVVQVLLVGLLLGAGLPALFALGVRQLAVAEGDLDGRRGSARAVAVGCFVAAIVVALLGVVVIVFGKQIFGT
ncbi:hypothetical protein HQQ80_16475 [Microbacteriaceae bacterium VKM Ac-2855]|nr:hypothetical protein [Microbacteriaceae bacterium VKM Ac-2855]